VGLHWDAVRREPFRVFFPLAILCGGLGVGHWLALALGWLPAGAGFFHASLQINVYLTGFIVGFLLTALPRFSNTSPASHGELLTALAFFVAQPILLSRGVWVAAESCFAALLLLVLCFAGRRFAARKSGLGPPPEFVWILFAVLHGIIGTGLLIWGQSGGPSWALATGRPMVQQGFPFGVVLGVGGFLAPRLMGRGFASISAFADDPKRARRVWTHRMGWHVVAAAAFFVSFWIEGRQAHALAYGLRAAIVTAELAWTTQFYRPPAVRAQYVRLLWMSLWLVVLGLWVSSIWTTHRVAGLHIAFLGGLSLMTFAVGTMVVFSHGGGAALLNTSWWALRLAAGTISVAMVARVAAEWATAHYTWLIGSSAALWLIGAVGWLSFILPWILRVPDPGTFERLHEVAKQQLTSAHS